MVLSEKIKNNIKKYLFKKTFLSNFPKEILFNLIKYSCDELIKYLLKANLRIDWKKLYYFLYKEKEINSPYTYPNNNTNKWINAIYNKNNKWVATKNILNDCDFVKSNNEKIYTTEYNYYREYKICKSGNRPFVIYSLILNSKNVAKIYDDYSYTTVLLKNGRMLSCGKHNYGQLGSGNTKKQEKFKFIKGIKNISEIFMNYDTATILLKNCQIMSCGKNYFGQLGLGDEKDRTKFELIPIIKNVFSVFYGGNNVIILLKNGTMIGAGNNEYGQLGLGDKENINKFELIFDSSNKIIKNVVKIFNTYGNTLILLKTGEVMGCGKNEYGELGLGDNKVHNKFEYIKDNRGENIKNISHIFQGPDFIMLLSGNGELLVCGRNGQSELGLGHNNSVSKFTLVPNVNNITQVFSEWGRIILVLNTGKLMSCGFNRFGRLGLGDKIDRNKFEFVPNVNNAKEITQINQDDFQVILTNRKKMEINYKTCLFELLKKK